MKYLLLTGATGLLGEYLVRDLSNRGYKLALLIRPHRKSCPRFDAHARILEGDLTQPDCGLSPQSLNWVETNCDSVLHCAASLKFQAATPEGEPWRTNLEGTRRLLDLTMTAGIEKFHFVSTAYVCGAWKEPVFYETSGSFEEPSNDYETSKRYAEGLVRHARGLFKPTIYRPAIIVGDSQSGYTSTYTGFYAPLKLMSIMLRSEPGVATTREELHRHIAFASDELLQITGTGRKNYVPVDWVSAAIASIVSTPAHHGKVYHLAPPEPVRFDLTLGVIQRLFSQYTELAEQPNRDYVQNWQDFRYYFAEGMKAYASYWRDDPVFDTTNTRLAFPTPCPTMDADLFWRCCQYAIETDFGRKAPGDGRRLGVRGTVAANEPPIPTL
jgi:thioester reductase-like protein